MMKSLKELDSVGWRFWALCSVVLYGPCFYFVWISMYEEKRGTTVPYSFAFIISTVVAAFLAAGANTVLQNRAEARLAAEKEAQKELNRSKKKGKKKNG